MIAYQQEHRLLLQLTDAEAFEMVARLTATLQRRRKLIEYEPSMKIWSDVSHVMPGTINDKGFIVTISIADTRTTEPQNAC